MPRKWKWIETVEEFPPLQPDRWYRVRVVSIDKDRARGAILIDLEHLDADQAGRRHSGAALGLPVRPAGLTADFFRAACGQDVAVGKEIAPKEAVGLILQARFAVSPDGTSQPTHFRPDPKASDARETALPTGGPRRQNESARVIETGQQGAQARQCNSRKASPAQPANSGMTSVETHGDQNLRKDPDHG